MEDLSKYYTLLRDPTRRKIIEILAAQEKVGFTELRESLGLGVGTVYYHLDMLSGFVEQDKQRKYRLNDRGQMLHRILKDGGVPAPLDIGEAFTHKAGKWVFLSPLFAKTAKPLPLLPVAVVVLLAGGLGAAFAHLDPALFFFFPYSVSSQAGIIAFYVLDWVGLFFFAAFFTYVAYRRVGNNLQLFTCIALATFPLALFPYIFMALSSALSQYVLLALQIWSLLLVSAAFCFGKGIRLDKALVVSLTAMYVNITILFLLCRFA